MLYTLGYSPAVGGDELDDDAFYDLPYQQIITEEAAWTTLLDDLGTTADLPDFSTQAAFIQMADGGGCGAPSTANAWAWSDRVRVGIKSHGDGGCDGGFLLLDVAVVDVGDADDLGWCR